MNVKAYIAVGLWLLTAVKLPAQHWSFQTYGTDAGLTNPNILALHQDRQGFIWVSTEGGLFRYDGDRFRPYTASSPGKAAVVRCLYTSSDGQLWAGSMAGLFHWSGDRFVPVLGPAERRTGQRRSNRRRRFAPIPGFYFRPCGPCRFPASGCPELLTSTRAVSVIRQPRSYPLVRLRLGIMHPAKAQRRRFLPCQPDHGLASSKMPMGKSGFARRSESCCVTKREEVSAKLRV